MTRVLLAGLFHETHTFVEDITRLSGFQTLKGDQLLACRGDGSPLGGFLEMAAQYGWEVTPTLDMRASPSGMVEDAVVETWWKEFAARADTAVRGGVDAVYLVLHGAMVSESFDDVEGELLERLRRLSGLGEVPVFGAFDLHATFTARMARHADCLVAYRENPHTDGCAMAMQAADLLHQTLQTGKTPRQYWQHSHVIWPPTGTGTAAPPMRQLEGLARRLEAEHPSFLAVNVVAGFSFADTPDTGVSFAISTTGDEGEAVHALELLCQHAWDARHEGNATDTPLDEVMRALEQETSGPIVVAEPSDNIGGGAPGDGTALLRALVKHGIDRAALCINDPGAVQQLKHVLPGETMLLPLGGKGSKLDEGPLSLEVTLISRSDGVFHLEDRQSHLASMCGTTFDMGPCAVVRHGGVTVLLTTHKTPPFDLGQWRSQGIEPEQLRVIAVKAAVAHRRAYEPIAARMLSVDTPGPCRSDLTKLPFKRVSRPVYPLDECLSSF